MTQTNVSNYQQQPAIAAHVAGTNWGQSFIAEDIFLPTDAGAEIFSYQTWDNAGLVSVGQSAKRGLRSKTKYVEPPKNGVVTAALEEYALETSIDYREINAAANRDKLAGGSGVGPNGLNSVDNIRLGMASNVDLKIQIEKEIDAAALLFDKTNYSILALRYTGAGGGETAKIDFAASGIIGNIQTVKRAVARYSGFEPDTFIVGYDMYLKLWSNADILARITGGANNTNPAIVNNQLLAAIFGVQQFVVTPGVTQAPAAAGAAGTPTDIWSATTSALVYSGRGQTPSVASPAFCKMFTMNVPATGTRKDVRTWLSNNGKLEYLELTEFAMPAVTFGAAGAFFIV